MTDFSQLTLQARRVREHAIRMATNGGCFIGASLSCADLLVYLYERVLRISPERLQDPTRDYLLLSKGHDVPALYGTLAELGYFPVGAARRITWTIDDHLYWHPNRAIPGVEFHSGSLGHLLSVGMGIALDVRLRARAVPRVRDRSGDGELDEGSVWEAALVAGAKKLDNLVVIVDRNGFQANLATEDLIPLEPLDEKLRDLRLLGPPHVDGHGFPALERAFATLPAHGPAADRDHRAHRAGQGPAQPGEPGRPLVRRPHRPTRSTMLLARAATAPPRRTLHLRRRWWCDERPELDGHRDPAPATYESTLGGCSRRTSGSWS